MDTSLTFIALLQKYMQKYGALVFKALSTGCLSIYAAVFACWLTWQFVWKGAIKGEIHFSDIMSPLITNLVIITLLSFSFMSDWLYKPIDALVTGLIEQLIAVINIPKSSHASNLPEVLKSQYDTLNHVFASLDALMKDTGFMFSLNSVASIILKIPFIFLYVLMLCYCIDYMFKLMLVTALAPILIIFAGFSPTRNIATSGLRMVLHGIFTILGSALAMGLCILVLQEMTKLMPLNANGTLTANAESFAFSEVYWSCFVTVCVAIYLQLKVPTIANITGVSDGPGAAGFVAGITSLTMGVAGGLTKYGAVKGSHRLASWAGPHVKRFMQSESTAASLSNDALKQILGDK